MPIQPTEPIVIPPTEGKTADTFWLQQMIINAPSFTEPVNVHARLIPYNSTTGESFPTRCVILNINDLLTQAATDPQLAATIQGLFAEIDRQAKMQGLI
jgi:hypothetical protein